MWQDYALTVASLMFGYSLIPQIIRNYRNKKVDQISWQMILVSLVAIIINIPASYTLELYMTTIMNCIQFVCWLLMMSQRFYYRNNS